MRYAELIKFEAMPFFTIDDASRILGVKDDSARVFCTRQVKAGFFVRLKKNFYVSVANWQRYSEVDFFQIANFLQVPSYISYMNALSFHGITTQVQRNWCESMSLKRSVTYAMRGREFHYHKSTKSLYFGFEKTGNFFIARKEKALIDACHLTAMGRYAFDKDSLDLDRLDRGVLTDMAAAFPPRTQNLVRRICGI
ncbi:MAG: hypothetical protein FJ139_10375 [Deltaproteobacteria bacterium]|nr:hypothetical protein [Deltaproteobacteria bacterium]